MASALLYGNGWPQRWHLVVGTAEAVRAELDHVGSDEVGRLPVIDPGTDDPTLLTVAWRHVAAAVVLGGADPDPEGQDNQGLYR